MKRYFMQTYCVIFSIALKITDVTLFMHIPPSPHGATAPRGPGPPRHKSFTIILRHTTLRRTPLHE
jgi:hypothetical protein